jgi:hypothetical protein
MLIEESALLSLDVFGLNSYRDYHISATDSQSARATNSDEDEDDEALSCRRRRV